LASEQPRSVSWAVVLVFVLSALLFLPVLDAYALDRAGQPFTVGAVGALLAIEAIGGGLAFRRWGRLSRAADPGRLVGLALVFLVTLGVGLVVSWPSFLPASPSVDIVHHYQLVDYFYRQQRLVHGTAELPYLAEMVQYPFGACLLVALLAHATGIDPLHLIFPFAAVPLACTATFAYATITELIPGRRANLIAGLVVPLYLWPYAYTMGQFTRDFYLTEMLGIAAVLGLIYWIGWYARSGRRLAAVPLVGLGAVLIVTYPTLLPPVALTFAAAPFLRRPWPSARRWLADTLLVGGPLLLVAGLYLPSRIDAGLSIMANNGATIDPSLTTLPPVFLALGLAGLVYATLRPGLRLLATATWLTGVQTAAYYGAVAAFAALSPYAAKKMFYLLVPELAVLGGLALVVGVAALAGAAGPGHPSLTDRRSLPGGGRAVLAVLAVAAILGLAVQSWIDGAGGVDPRQFADFPLSPDQVAVTAWAQTHLDRATITYLTDRPMTAYWIDVGLFRNPRLPATSLDQRTISPADFPTWYEHAAPGAEAFVTNGVDALVGVEATAVFRVGDAAIIRKRTASTVYFPGGVPLLDAADPGASGLVLQSIAVPRRRAAPGDRVTVAIDLRTSAWLRRHYLLSAQLRDASGHVWTQVTQPLSPFSQNIHIGADAAVDRQVSLTVPPTIPAGLYTVSLVFFDDNWGTLRPVFPPDAPRRAAAIGPLLIAPAADLPPPSFRPPTVLNDQLGGQLSLVGTDPPQVTDQGLSLALYWQTAQPVPRDYSVFVQLLDPAGQVVAQADGYPWGGRLPTSAWPTGQLIRDPYRLTWPRPLPPGTYRLIAGMYLLQTMQRLPVAGPTGQPIGSAIPLATLIVSPG
jgi:hypothetical protein